MRQQLRQYALRQLRDAMAVGHATSKAELIQLGTLKDLMREQARHGSGEGLLWIPPLDKGRLYATGGRGTFHPISPSSLNSSVQAAVDM